MTPLHDTCLDASNRAYQLASDLNLARAYCGMDRDADAAVYLLRAREQIRDLNALFARLRIPTPAQPMSSLTTRGNLAPAAIPPVAGALSSTEAS